MLPPIDACGRFDPGKVRNGSRKFFRPFVLLKQVFWCYSLFYHIRQTKERPYYSFRKNIGAMLPLRESGIFSYCDEGEHPICCDRLKAFSRTPAYSQSFITAYSDSAAAKTLLRCFRSFFLILLSNQKPSCYNGNKQ